MATTALISVTIASSTATAVSAQHTEVVAEEADHRGGPARKAQYPIETITLTRPDGVAGLVRAGERPRHD